jgi:tRNA:m4X modification enzyme
VASLSVPCLQYCSAPRRDGSLYCGTHVDASESRGKVAKGTRIPCPVDPSHSIFESQLKRHVAKCNVTKREREQDGLAFIQRGVNFGTCVEVDAASIAAVFGDTSRTLRQALVGADVATACVSSTWLA